MKTTNTLNSKTSRSLMLVLVFSFTYTGTIAQTRLVLNGGIINLNQAAYLVIDNSNANAITRNTGHIISEGESNRVKWNIGTTTGTYTMPWGVGSTNYIPLTFTKSAGSGTGHFLFSTYHTTWNNIAQLPTGVTNINGSTGTDNSAYVSDRFWQVNAVSYSTKPALTNLQFTYLDSENAAPNTIVEANLRAKRYNSSLNSWTDNVLTNSINTTINTVTVTSVDAANLQTWWMLGTLNSDRYWVASSNSTSNISANWSETAGGSGNAGVPTIGDAVFFDGSSDFNCTLDADLSASSLSVNSGFSGAITQGPYAIVVNNDAIFSGGSFIGGSSPLTVNGDLTISGTTFTAPTSIEAKRDVNITSGSFIHNNGTVVFSGTNGSSQNITGTTTFNNISVTNTTATPGVNIGGNHNLKGILTLASNVTVDADGLANTGVLKLLSSGDSPTQDASIAILPSGAQILGNVTVQRFMSKEGPNSNRIYRYISSPVQNATVSDLQQEIPVTGSFTGRSTCVGCVSSSQSLFAYNESIIVDNDGSGVYTEHDGYIDFPDITNTEIFQPGKGYALYVRGNLLTTTLWDVRGPVNNGNVTPLSFPVSYTNGGNIAYDGWNLVGNPFPSTIDWNAASGWTKTNVDGSIYMTDNGGPAIQTASWNGVTGTNGGSRYIAMGQGFWTKGNGSGAPVLQANENIKVAGIQTTFIREGAPDNLLRITMVQGLTRDEAVVHFREDATEGFDSQADALKLANSTFNLSTLQVNGMKLAINSVSPITCNTGIKLNIENATAGNYRLNFSEYESFPDNIEISFFDNLTGNSVDIRTNNSYDFTVSSNAASYGSERFKVTFQFPPLDSELLVSAASVCEGSDGVIRIENTQHGVSYDISSGSGSVMNSAIGNGGFVELTIPVANLNQDENQFTLTSHRQGCDAKVEQPVLLVVSQKYSITMLEATKACLEGSVTIHAAGAPSGGRYNWYETEDSAMPIPDQHSDTLITPVLSKSKTYYVAAVNESGCEGSKQSVLAEVAQFEMALISVGDNIGELVSNYENNNEWYLDSETIPLASGQSISPEKSGTYLLTVNVDGCITSSTYEYNVTGVEESKVSYISVFPNPVVNELSITIPDSFQFVTEITLINSAGQVVRTMEKIKQGDRVFHFDVGNLPSGVYVLRVLSSKGIHEQKIIKS